MPDGPTAPRQRLLSWLGVIIVAVFAAHRGFRSDAPPYTPIGGPPIVIPDDTQPDLASMLRELHGRYNASKASGGTTGLRFLISRDLKRLANSEEGLSLIVAWIDLAGWDDAADLLIEAADVGSPAIRISCAALVMSRSTDLLTAGKHGPRIVRLHMTETEPLAKEYWLEVRRRLGV